MIISALPIWATLVILHVNAITMNPNAPRARCVVLEGDTIDKVSDSETACMRPGAQIIDGRGATLVPGFNDAHVHLGIATAMTGAAIAPQPREKWLDAVRALASRRPYGAWLVARSFELPAGVHRARDLDFIDHPVLVITRRGALLNHRGLAQLHLATVLPDGFVPGRLVAAALARVIQALPYEEKLGAARSFIEQARSIGMTSVQFISEEMPTLFENLRTGGELTMRVRFVPLGYRFDTMFHQTNWESPAPLWVRVDGIKYYHDDAAQLSERSLAEIVRFIRQRHLRAVFHVLGRFALRKLLHAIERGTADDPSAARLIRLDHVDEAGPEDAERIAKLGLPVCANPPLIAEWNARSYGPLATLLRSGVRLCMGSDWVGKDPARPLAPIRNIAIAATHGGNGSNERISAAQALEAYTRGSAHAEGLETHKGSIEKGKLADLVLLSQDPTAVPVEKIPQTIVLMTIVGGRIVYRASDQESARDRM